MHQRNFFGVYLILLILVYIVGLAGLGNYTSMFQTAFEQPSPFIQLVLGGVLGYFIGICMAGWITQIIQKEYRVETCIKIFLILILLPLTKRSNVYTTYPNQFSELIVLLLPFNIGFTISCWLVAGVILFVKR